MDSPDILRTHLGFFRTRIIMSCAQSEMKYGWNSSRVATRGRRGDFNGMEQKISPISFTGFEPWHLEALGAYPRCTSWRVPALESKSKREVVYAFMIRGLFAQLDIPT